MDFREQLAKLEGLDYSGLFQEDFLLTWDKTEDEIRAAALQYVRKVSGFAKPSQSNQPAFEQAVKEITEATQRLFDSLQTTAPTRDREVEAVKAKERSQKRFSPSR